MASFQLLDQREEDELHKTRLLNVEEKPFKRITKRLLTPGSLISSPSKLPPTPPPDSMNGDDASEDHEAIQQKRLEERRQFREDVLLDFAAFDSSIARIQFLRNSNERERERYAAEKIRIMEAAQAVKDNTGQLRVQLESARATLDQRKKFDELAEKITNNRLLRPREDQEINLLKLEEECKELEKESHTYSETWKERREQFGRIVEEGMQLRRLIRDEKEEVERREGMDGGEEDGEVGESGSRGGATPKHNPQSGGATPRPDGGSSPRQRSSSGNQTPAVGDGINGSDRKGLKPLPLPSGALSGPGSRVGSRAPSPAGSEREREEPEEGEDTTMAEAEVDTPMAGVTDTPAVDGETLEPPQVTVNAHAEPGTGDEDVTQPVPDDRMDVT